MFTDIPDFEVMRLSNTFFMSEEASSYSNSDEDYLQFLIPDRSGLSHGRYWDYVATRSGLSIYYQSNSKRTWKAWYPIDPELYKALELMLSETDSLGFHYGSGSMFFGLRFFVHVKKEERKMDGTIAGCYREHVFRLVDWINHAYPYGDLIYYDKQELLLLEMQK